MNLPDHIFKPERYTYNDYLLWKGDWELVNGYPYAMDPFSTRRHQWFLSKFIQLANNEIDNYASRYVCETYLQLNWIIDDITVVSPDCMIVCGNFTADFLNFPPTLIVEISSMKTKLRDRNAKYNLYELQGVRYYLLADTEKKLVEAFELVGGKYVPMLETYFRLTDECEINLDVFNLWQLM